MIFVWLISILNFAFPTNFYNLLFNLLEFLNVAIACFTIFKVFLLRGLLLRLTLIFTLHSTNTVIIVSNNKSPPLANWISSEVH
uniref:Uncharacterized protein n=1 Tax=Candidatus Kentrum sp. LFY TaxID=2126342 RepID=A0A450VB51_9GAMM|nr:MAG: hypothetical protein BECKLFY1418A_GA0070994_11721 [Candidatus Kentron sp. LFY]